MKDESLEELQEEIQNLKRKVLYSTVIFVLIVVIYNFTLIQCLFGYNRIQGYYQKTLQLHQDVLMSLETVSSQCQEIAEDYEEFQQFLHQM